VATFWFICGHHIQRYQTPLGIPRLNSCISFFHHHAESFPRSRWSKTSGRIHCSGCQGTRFSWNSMDSVERTCQCQSEFVMIRNFGIAVTLLRNLACWNDSNTTRKSFFFLLSHVYWRVEYPILTPLSQRLRSLSALQDCISSVSWRGWTVSSSPFTSTCCWLFLYFFFNLEIRRKEKREEPGGRAGTIFFVPARPNRLFFSGIWPENAALLKKLPGTLWPL